MKRVLIAAAAALAAGATLAACGGGGGGDGSASPAGGAQATVSARELGDAGSVLVDTAGRALYAADQETGGQVLCTGACTSFWVPLTVPAGTPSGGSLTGKLGVVRRPDGTRQLTYGGKPLYAFAPDQPGQVTGDGVSDAFGSRHFTWHVVHADGSTGSSSGGSSGRPYGY